MLDVRQPVLGILIGVSLAGCGLFEKGESPAGPSAAASAPPAPGAAIHYAAIGASDANGIGSTAPCAPFEACSNGNGYVPVLGRALRINREVTVTNLGLPGAVLSPAIEQLARQYGRDVTGNFVDREMPFVPRDANLITVFGGGNDVNAVTEAVERGAGGSNVRGYIDSQVRAFGADYDRLIRGVRDRAPGAFVIVINVPNFAALPYASGYSEQRRQVMQYTSAGFSREANRQATSGVVVLDLMCDAQAYDRSRFSSDGFHPNDAGYAYLAQRLVTIAGGTASPPAATCGQMTIVPPL